MIRDRTPLELCSIPSSALLAGCGDGGEGGGGNGRERGMSIGLKNHLYQISALVEDFDFAVNEQCAEHGGCDKLTPFIHAVRPSSTHPASVTGGGRWWAWPIVC